MRKDDIVYLLHNLDAIGLIKEYTEGMSENEFLSHPMAHDAVIRQIETIGEAARNVSEELRELHPELPWGKRIGVRNKIIHEYFNVNFAIVWDTVQDDLPARQKAMKSVLK